MAGESPPLPADFEIDALRELLKTDQAPRESWRQLIEMLLNAYVYAKASVQTVLRECDVAVLGLTRSADAEIERLNTANVELRSKLAQAEADGRQAASNCVDAQMECERMRNELASWRHSSQPK